MVPQNHRHNFGGTSGLEPRDSRAWLVRMEMPIQDCRGCARQGRSLHPARGMGVWGMLSWGRMARQVGNPHLGVLGPGWTPDPSPDWTPDPSPGQTPDPSPGRCSSPQPLAAAGWHLPLLPGLPRPAPFLCNNLLFMV